MTNYTIKYDWNGSVHFYRAIAQKNINLAQAAFRFFLINKGILKDATFISIKADEIKTTTMVVDNEQISKRHDKIICPNCQAVERAEILETHPFETFVHICSKCDYTIMESEWLSISEQQL